LLIGCKWNEKTKTSEQKVRSVVWR
jgi:hypothetical protein